MDFPNCRIFKICQFFKFKIFENLLIFQIQQFLIWIFGKFFEFFRLENKQIFRISSIWKTIEILKIGKLQDSSSLPILIFFF